MTGYLGFDRARVRALLAALDDLEGERARLGHDTDVEADAPLLAYRSAVQRLLEWQPRLHAVLGYADGSAYHDVDASWRLADAIVLTSGGRWRDVVHDPRRVPPRRHRFAPAARAAALAALLTRIDLDELVLDEDLVAAVLGELQQVASSPAAAARLLSLIGLPRFHTIAAALGERWLAGVGSVATAPHRPDGDQLRSVLEGLGAVVGAAWSPHRDAASKRCSALLGGLPVAALAPMLAGAAQRAPGAVPTSELVAGALRALDTAAAAHSHREGAALTDPILAALATDGVAARRVLELLSDASFETLFAKPRHDPELLAAALLASNDPATTTAAAVEASMRRVFAVLADHRHEFGHAPIGLPSADVPPHLGIYTGRWAEAIIDGWAVDRATTIDHLGWLAARPAVAVELLVTLQLRYEQGVAEVTGERGDLANVAYAHAALADLVAHAELGEALADEASWARLVAGVQFALDAAAVAVTPVAPPVGAGLGAASLASSGAEAAGVSPSSWLVDRLTDRPQAVRDVLARQAVDRDVADATMEHVAVAATVAAFEARHPSAVRPAPPPAPRLPASPDPPGPDDPANQVGRDYHERLREWVDDLATSGDRGLQDLARDVNRAALDVRGAALDARNHLAA